MFAGQIVTGVPSELLKSVRFTLRKKRRFSLKIFLVNVSKSTENCGIVRIN